MKTYRIPGWVHWMRGGAKVLLTTAAGVAYVAAVSHPTPMGPRLLLLALIVSFGWLFYVRLPKMPTEIEIAQDGWVHFRGRRGSTRVHVASIQSIGQKVGRRTVRLRYNGGRLLLPNRFRGFYDFLATVKGLNPAIDIRGF